MEQSKQVDVESHAGKRQFLEEAFNLCVRKTRRNIKRLADEPKSAAWAVDGNYFAFPEGFFEIGNWTSSFFTGMALIAWNETEDEFFLQETTRLAWLYRDKVFVNSMDTHHDLGFLYSLYSLALHKLTQGSEHQKIALRAADVLASRFNPAGKFIRAWGRMDTDEFADMAIIDSLMNLPLLYWATETSGDARYREIAVAHANTVLENFLRPDGSVYHAYRFDPVTGQPARGDTYGGCAVESHWARGAAWAIYGFALSHRHTGDRRFLEAALRVARRFIANLDEKVVPLWDFKLAPGAVPLRDASAASVALCGMQELLRQQPNDAQLGGAVRLLLSALCSREWLNFDEQCPGLQTNGQVGNGIPGGAQNAYTSWGDYFLMEALARELFHFESWW